MTDKRGDMTYGTQAGGYDRQAGGYDRQAGDVTDRRGI